MISLEDARQRILDALEPLPPETVPLLPALGRAPVADVFAPADLPPFDNSSVDGFAVQAIDVATASPDQPVRLKLTTRIAAGESPTAILGPGTCARILTGGVLPAGADAVVMQEDTRQRPGDTVEIHAPTAPWENVRLAGEDLRRGARLVAAGERLRPAHIGLLAANGFGTVAVRRRPRVTLLVTGSELLEPGAPLAPGKIYNSNRFLLAALADADHLPITAAYRVPDSLEGTMTSLAEAARQSDVVVTTGGVSVGDADFVKPAVAALGGSVEIWRLAVKPGKPLAWGRLEAAHWFGLPGNPVSAFVMWWLVVRPALRRLVGIQSPLGRRIQATLGEPFNNRGERRHFVRVRLDAEGKVRLAGTQASHIQSGLANADALLDLPPLTSWPAGHPATVELLGD